MITNIVRDLVPNGEYLTVFLYDNGTEVGFLRVILTNPKLAVFRTLYLHDLDNEDNKERYSNELLVAASNEIGKGFLRDISHLEYKLY